MGAADLDGDGRLELALAVSRWRAWDLRILRAAPTGGLELLARQPVGFVQTLAPVQTPEGTRLFLVAGPTEGLGTSTAWLASWDGAALTLDPLALDLPQPLRQTQWGDAPVGDVDGDGLQDIVVQVEIQREQHVIVLRQLPGGAWTQVTLTGLDLVGAWDEDGDGDLEVLVEQGDSKRQWLLGAGSDAIPVHPSAAAAPPALEGLVQAADLDAMGLSGDAALTAELAAASSEKPVEVLVWAAERWAARGESERATALFEEAMALEPPSPALREAWATQLARTHHHRQAREAWEVLVDDGHASPASREALAWLRPLELPRTPLVVDFAEHLDPAWRVEQSLSVHRVPAENRLVLEPLALSQPLLRLPLRRVSNLVELAFELRVSEMELGSALAMDLWCDDTDRAQLRWWMRFHGGQGRLLRSIHGGSGFQHVGVARAQVSPETFVEDIAVTLHHVQAQQTVDVTVRSAQGLPGLDVSIPLDSTPWGDRCELVIGPSTHPNPGGLARMRVELASLSLLGLEIDHGDEPTTPARTLLADGRPSEALPLLDAEDVEGRATALVDLGRLDDAAAEVARAIQRGTSEGPALVRALDPTLGQLLQRKLGSSYFEAWMPAFALCLAQATRCAAPLLEPRFTAMRGETVAQRSLLLSRAALERQEGLLERATTDLERLLDQAAPQDGEIPSQALLLLAQVRCDQQRPGEARRLLQTAQQRSLTPALLVDQLKTVRASWSCD